MANIILYASSHAFLNISINLTGGIEYISPVNNILSFHSSSHSWGRRADTTLKGGELTRPASLAELNDSSGFSIPGVSALAAGFCSDFGDKLDGILGSLDQGKNMLNSPFDLLRGELNGLSGMAASPINDISNGLGSLADTALDAVPPLPDVGELERIMQACGLLRGGLLDGILDPLALLGDFLGQLLSMLDGLMSLALGALGDILGLIEAGAAFILNEINKLLSLLGIDKLLAKLDGLLNCIEAICGRSFSVPTIVDPVNPGLKIPKVEKFYMDYIDDTMKYVDNILNDMNLNDFGKFEPEKMFAEFKNIPQDVFNNIKTIADKVVEETKGAGEMMAGLVKDMEPMMNNLVADLKEAADVFPGTKEEMLAVVDKVEEEVKELVTTLEESVNPDEQKTLIAQISSTKDAALETLNPVIQKVQDMKSFFT